MINMEHETFTIRVVIYCRVSTKEQAEGKYSIPEQIKKCQEAIAYHGWQLVRDPYVDVETGHVTDERKNFSQLMFDAKQNLFDLVAVYDFDRFARNRSKATQARDELKKLFIQTYSCNTPVEPKNPKLYDPIDDDLAIMVEGYSDTFSEIERNKIRRRMMMGKVAIAQSGKIPNNVPYGYTIKRTLDEHGKVHRDIEVNQEQAKVIQRIFDSYIKGKGQLEIAFQLNESRIKPPRGQYWTKQSIKYILHNETYTGMVKWGWRHAEYAKNKQRRLRGHQGITVQGTHTPIIDPQIYNLAQKEKKIRGNSQKGRAKLSRGLMTGIAKCIRCGSGVTYVTRHHHRKRKNPKWNDTTTHEYLCGGYKYRGICQRRVMGADKLESYVLSMIKNLLNNPKAREKLILDKELHTDDHLKGEIAQSMKVLDDIPNRMRKQQEAFESGSISMEIYASAIKRLQDLQKLHRAVTDSYNEKLIVSDDRRKELEKFVKNIENFDELWDESSFEEKKHFLRQLISAIHVGNGKIDIDFRF